MNRYSIIQIFICLSSFIVAICIAHTHFVKFFSVFCIIFFIFQYFLHFNVVISFIGSWKQDAQGNYIPTGLLTQILKVILSIIYFPFIVGNYYIEVSILPLNFP